MFVTINKESKDDFLEAINFAYKMHNPKQHSDYSGGRINKQKENIRKLFVGTSGNKDIEFLRLKKINKEYSTHMEKNGLVEMSKIIKAEGEDLKIKELFMNYFENNQQEEFIKELFDGKYGQFKKHYKNEYVSRKAQSLISKYAYFLTDFKFSIYDEFMRQTLNFLGENGKVDSDKIIDVENFEHNYFQYIYKLCQDLKTHEGFNKNTVDKLDAFGWSAGKRRRDEKFKEWDKSKVPEFDEMLKKLGLLV